MTWRKEFAPLIRRAIEEASPVDTTELRTQLRAVYPRSERKHWPYRVWCDEVNRQLGKRTYPGESILMIESLEEFPVDRTEKAASGIVCHVICQDPEAHRELLALCLTWHRKKPNSMFVDGEQSVLSYKQERSDD